jgi:hypothetical protein
VLTIVEEEFQRKAHQLKSTRNYYDRLTRSFQESKEELTSLLPEEEKMIAEENLTLPLIQSYLKMKESMEKVNNLKQQELKSFEDFSIDELTEKSFITEEEMNKTIYQISQLGIEDNDNSNYTYRRDRTTGKAKEVSGKTDKSSFVSSPAPSEGVVGIMGYFPTSNILTNVDLDKILFSMLSSSIVFLTPSSFELLYQGSRDGFNVPAFHQKCNDKGAAVVIMKDDQGNIFGGYTSVGWTTPEMLFGSYYADESNTSFLFSLKNPHGLKPTKMPLLLDCAQYSIFCEKESGPSFGRGGNIMTKDMKTAEFHFSIHKTPSYLDLSNLGDHLFASKSPAPLIEIEVWKV